MPKILEDCVSKVKLKKGSKKVNPYAVCTASLQKAGKMAKKA